MRYCLILICAWFSLYKLVKLHLKIKGTTQLIETDIQNRIVASTHGLIAFWFNLILLITAPELFKYLNILLQLKKQRFYQHYASF